MEVDPVAEQPWVLPLFVRYRAINVLEYLARIGALLDAIKPHCAEFFSVYPPSSQDPIAVGLEVDCCTRFIGETGLLVKLAGTLVEVRCKLFVCLLFFPLPFSEDNNENKYILRRDDHCAADPAQQPVHLFLLPQ